MKSEFPYPRLALAMAMVAAYPIYGHAAAGLVQFSAGDVQLRRGDSTMPAAKGGDVESGDVVSTGAAGRAQIRFSDGGLVALYPDTQFVVARYADRGDPAQDSFLVNLVRGGMRAITGLIGKRDARNYRVTTPTATIGIRGSAFRVVLSADGQVLVAGEQDEIEVCTRAGCISLKVGESAIVAAEDELPRRTNTRAGLPLPPLMQSPAAAGNQIDTQGHSVSVQIVPEQPPPAPPPPIEPVPAPPPPVVSPPPPVVSPPPPVVSPPPPVVSPPPPAPKPPPAPPYMPPPTYTPPPWYPSPSPPYPSPPPTGWPPSPSPSPSPSPPPTGWPPSP
ncbi:FecR family protein [Ramlibacter sp. H39-3-26]|uniref:FecR family protein n=1 Tax=Curvibacter soli TaxID=3031331 RepID=UPI0023DB16F3|nr:FecR family protein [Ramlibacter sp. H39-3-26]MDF1483833.1 FecR family protein [Ramlibacter sp. H39-3-26]